MKSAGDKNLKVKPFNKILNFSESLYENTDSLENIRDSNYIIQQKNINVSQSFQS